MWEMRFGDIILMACGSGDMVEKRRLHKTVNLLTLGSGNERVWGISAPIAGSWSMSSRSLSLSTS